MTENIKGRVKGLSPFKTCVSPSPLKERGIKLGSPKILIFGVN